MARPRVKAPKCFMIVSGDSIINLETTEEREKAIRRAKFEKDYKRNKKVFSCITKSLDLVNFSDSFAQEIASFKRKKLQTV